MFRIIKYKKSYTGRVKELLKDDVNAKDIHNPLILVRGPVVNDKGEIVAFGYIKIIGEAAIALDSKLDRNSRAEIIDMFCKIGCHVAKKKGLDELDAFIRCNKKFANFLLKRLDFIETRADVLVKRL
jgi:hypothetical protein